MKKKSYIQPASQPTALLPTTLMVESTYANVNDPNEEIDAENALIRRRHLTTIDMDEEESFLIDVEEHDYWNTGLW